MGARGPAPRSTALKVIDGNPSRRPISDREPRPEGKPIRPKHVEKYAKEVWDRIIKSMPDTMYTSIDTEVLSAYCIASALHKQATDEIKINGSTYVDNNGNPKKHPWTTILNDQASIMAKLGDKLGCNPSSRVNLKVGDKKQKSKFAGLTGLSNS